MQKIEIRFSTCHAFPVRLENMYKAVKSQRNRSVLNTKVSCNKRKKDVKSNYNYHSRVLGRAKALWEFKRDDNNGDKSVQDLLCARHYSSNKIHNI